MKKITILTIFTTIFSFVGCSVPTQDEWLNSKLEEKACGHTLYHHPDFDNLTSYTMIAEWIANHITYGSDDENADTWNDPKTTIENGYGDCEDYVLLFMNIAYYGMGKTISFGTVTSSNLITKEIIDGGYYDHAIGLDNNTAISAFTGKTQNYSSIAFRIGFWQFFTNGEES